MTDDTLNLRGPYMLAPPGMGFNFSTAVVDRHGGTCKAPAANTAQPPLFQCSYCRSKFSSFGGSCPNCGSSDSEVMWLPYQSSYFPKASTFVY